MTDAPLPQFLQESTILIEHGEMPGEGRHVADGVDERVVHMLANVGTDLGDQGHASESETQPDFIRPCLLQLIGITLSNDAEPAA